MRYLVDLYPCTATGCKELTRVRSSKEIPSALCAVCAERERVFRRIKISHTWASDSLLEGNRTYRGRSPLAVSLGEWFRAIHYTVEEIRDRLDAKPHLRRSEVVQNVRAIWKLLDNLTRIAEATKPHVNDLKNELEQELMMEIIDGGGEQLEVSREAPRLAIVRSEADK
jgi:hypothetical protein